MAFYCNKEELSLFMIKSFHTILSIGVSVVFVSRFTDCALHYSTTDQLAGIVFLLLFVEPKFIT